MTRHTTRVAIIGAGATGLAQLKQLIEAFSRDSVRARTHLEVVVFEGKNEVGGVWHSDMKVKPYVKACERDKGKGKAGDQLYFYPPGQQDPSPMYEGLKTNLPYDLMSFRDLPYPDHSALFPDRASIQAYLELYARTFDLYPHIRFNTLVTRLYQQTSARRWTIESRQGDEDVVEEFDHVTVANGHYSDVWVPAIPGLRQVSPNHLDSDAYSGTRDFPGEITHSRFYRAPEDYSGKRVLIVGSYASGSDLSRQIASLNLDNTTSSSSSTRRPYTTVYVSSSGTPNSHNDQGKYPPQPWTEYITHIPLISHYAPPSSIHPHGLIHFQAPEGQAAHEPLEAEIDNIIFATGYNFALPFCKETDAPWNKTKILDGTIHQVERAGGREGDVGGMKGLGVDSLDELLLFLKDDQSIAFPVLQYQVVPFPLAEAQGRLTSLLWAKSLPSFPDHPKPPHNPSNPYYTDAGPASSPDGSGAGKPVRKVLAMRKKLVFGAPYEWTYEEFLMGLCLEADVADGIDTPDHWRRIEPWRRDRRADADLRRRTLGF